MDKPRTDMITLWYDYIIYGVHTKVWNQKTKLAGHDHIIMVMPRAQPNTKLNFSG